MTEALNSSHILISQEIEEEIISIKNRLYPARIVAFFKEDEFKVDDARAVIREAYIAEAQTKYIILASKFFNETSQNALLKLLEEPPRNIEFIIITESKSALLPTVRSRLPLISHKSEKKRMELEISLKKLDLAAVFAFIKANDRTPKHEAKELIEALYDKAMQEEMLLNTAQLESFETAYKLLGLNARMNSVLSMLLMKFIKKS